MGTGQLAGIRVLDLTSVVMGPYATQLLGDLGADVITVEPARGDSNRGMGPGPLPQLSGVALNLLRNKRNISVDFRQLEGRRALLAVAATCDVLVTNLRPDTLKRAGLTHEDVISVRPNIIYCQAHGYRSDSPRANDPAYDDVIQAETGIADITSRLTGRPMLSATLMADKVCGLTIVYAVTASLYRRAVTGQGERIEVPMVDAMKAFTLVEHGAAAIAEPALGPAGYSRVLTQERGPWPTRDGWIMALPYTREHFDSIFNATERLDLVGDERYSTASSRIANAPYLYKIIGSMMLERTTVEWLELFALHDIPASPVATLDELVAELPLVEHPSAGHYRQIPPAVVFENAPMSVRRPAPLIGQHTDEIMIESGYNHEMITALRKQGALGVIPAEFT